MTDGIGERTNGLCSIIRVFHAMVIFPMFLLGQSSVKLTGVVEDESRAAVAGAKVVLMNQTSGQTQETVSGAPGSFSFWDLSPGDSILKVGATSILTNRLRRSSRKSRNQKCAAMFSEISGFAWSMKNTAHASKWCGDL